MYTSILSSLPLSAEIYTVNKEPADRGDLQAKFAVFSDLHLNKDNGATTPDNPGKGNGIEDFIRALSFCNGQGLDFAAVCGDIGDNAYEFNDTKEIYEGIIDAVKPDFPVYCVKGNHDQGIDDNEFKQTFTNGKNALDYSFDINNNRFIFMSLKHRDIPDYGQGTQLNPFSEDTLEFLNTEVNTADGKTLHIFMHFPPNALRQTSQFAGLGESPHIGWSEVHYVCGYGFQLSYEDQKWSNEQNTYILDLLKDYDGKSVVYSGHSHLCWQAQTSVPNVMFAQAFRNVWTAHLPSLNKPRNRDWTEIVGDAPQFQPSQGYIVKCYEDVVMLDCIEFNQYCAPYGGYVLQTYSVPLN